MPYGQKITRNGGYTVIDTKKLLVREAAEKAAGRSH
jgi:hypothetical protein